MTMVEDGQNRKVTRRIALKLLAGAAGAAAHGGGPTLYAIDGAHCHTPAIVKAGASAAPQFFSGDQMRVLSAFTEILVPTDEHSPGAAAAGVPAYIDSILSAAAAEPQEMWKQGLEAVDRLAKSDFAKPFADCSTIQQEEILLKLCTHEDNPVSPEEKFFVAAKQMTIEGYYNSRVGLDQDLQFVGNEALAEFEGCTHPEHGALASEKG